MPTAPRSRAPTAPTATLASTTSTLWRPGRGYLYTLDIEVLGPDGELVDVYPQPFGVRTVAVDGHRFLINGEPFYFTGFGKHEDFAGPRPRPRPRGHGP